MKITEGNIVEVTNPHGEVMSGIVTVVWKTDCEGILRVRFKMRNGNEWNVHTNTHDVKVIGGGNNFYEWLGETVVEGCASRPEVDPYKPRQRNIRNDCFGLSWDQIEKRQGGQLVR